MAGDPVTELVDDLAHHLQRSVVVDDPALQLLYASAHFGDEDPARVSALLRHGAEPRHRTYVLGLGVLTWHRLGRIPADPDLQLKARVCMPLRHRGELLGLLMVVDDDASLSPAELDRLTEAAAPIALSLHVRAQAASRVDAVLDLVAAQPATRRGAMTELRAVGRSGRLARLTAVRIGAASTLDPGAEVHLETVLRHALAARSREGTLTVHGVVSDGAATLVLAGAAGGGEQPGDRVAALLESVADLSGGVWTCVAGIGSTVSALEDAPLSLRRATVAWRAARWGIAGPVCAWAELGAYGPLLSLPEQLLDEDLLPEELQRLRAVDHLGQLALTVSAYLTAAGNAPRAAAALNIHRTTLYYRLSQVAERTGLDLGEGSTRAALQVGFAIADIIARRDGTGAVARAWAGDGTGATAPVPGRSGTHDSAP